MRRDEMPAWQVRRTRLNHDLLKNRYMPALAKWLNILEGRVKDANFAPVILGEILPLWIEISSKAKDLAQSFEFDMSPARLLDNPPLERCSDDSKGWLADILHSTWLKRCGISDIRESAITAINAADLIYVRLANLVVDMKPGEVRAEDLIVECRRFQTACAHVAHSIERYPNTVELQ